MRIARGRRCSARMVAVAFLAAGATLLATASPALAQSEGTGWEAFAQAYPTNLHPGGDGTIQIVLMNTGARRSSGAIRLTDTLPQGVTATAAGGMPENGEGNVVDPESEEIKLYGGKRWDCEGIGTETVTCTSDPRYLEPLPIGAGKKFDPAERIAIEVQIEAGAGEGRLANLLSIAGGGAPLTTTVSDPLTLSASEPGYGLSGWDVWFTNADGTVDTDAGSHPYETTFALGFNELADGSTAGGEIRNLEAVLPPGFFGEPNSTPACTRAQLDAAECPVDTQIGYNLAFGGGEKVGPLEQGHGPVLYFISPVYNMVPPPGVVDQFALSILGHAAFFDTGPQGFGEYNLITHINNIPVDKLDGNILMLWGVSAEASHDAGRVSESKTEEGKACETTGCSSAAPPRPFLTLPTSCEGPQTFTINGLGTWEDGSARDTASVLSHNSEGLSTGFTGCSFLSFDPSISTALDTGRTDTPAGLAVNVGFPQEALRLPESLAESTDQNTTVSLPQGIVINPGQAAGLQACTEAQARLQEEGAAQCPLASKVGSVKVQTPLLEGAFEKELTGNVYVMNGDPPNLRLLIAISGDGINLKLLAHVHLDEATGQLTTTLTKTPGVPFTSFELDFSGGARAALATPTQCGTYTSTSDFTPWASPFVADANPSSSFQLTSGANGSACPSSVLPFRPELIAGATTDQAGGYTNFSMLLQRGDGQQRIDRLQFKTPAGLTGLLSKVTLCTNAQAESDACPISSQIGHTTVESGPGPYPLVVPEPGQEPAPIYITEKYDGAPFGLSIVVPLHVGPFTLPTQRVRARIEIDPITAQLTITTNALPQIVAGVPTDLRMVDAVVERPQFMVNPTNCEPTSFTGTAYGSPAPGEGGAGASAVISSHFQVGSCRSLEFKPSFRAGTSGKTSRRDGASLHVAIAYPKAAQGTQANIKEVKVELPKALPSRLSTLQKACTLKKFEANPAACPAASIVGHAKATTPVLPVPLEGPAYFVSNGTVKFPELVLVLQGYGITIELHGETFISKSGITSSTFTTVPDQPVSSFELTLPQGEYSALAANGDLCRESLAMPTAMIAQNGAELRQSTQIAVSGCPHAIGVDSHLVRGRTLTLRVSVPAAGRLSASGRGLGKVAVKAGGRETLTLTLRERSAKAMKSVVTIAFTPSTGGRRKTISKTLRASFG
jgi:hypothetical protein